MKIKFTEDEELKRAILDKLKSNGGFCPCAIIHNQDTMCMCKDFRESKEVGECHCGLYIRYDENEEKE